MYNSYTSISYKSAAADLHRNLKPLQRMALLSRGFRLYHLHKARSLATARLRAFSLVPQGFGVILQGNWFCKIFACITEKYICYK